MRVHSVSTIRSHLPFVSILSIFLLVLSACSNIPNNTTTSDETLSPDKLVGNYTISNVPYNNVVIIDVIDSVPQYIQRAYATGSIINKTSTHYYILTNFHAVDLAVTNLVRLPNGTMVIDSVPKAINIIFKDRPARTARVLGYDEALDFVLLEVPIHSGYQPIDPVQLGTSQQVSGGDTVYVVGNPSGLMFSHLPAFVSGTDRLIGVPGRKIQLNIPFAPGTSGGIVLDKNGKLVGLVQGNVGVQITGITMYGIAIPIDYIIQEMDQLLAGDIILHGTIRARFMRAMDLPEQVKLARNIPDTMEGIAVIGIDQRSNAARSGLQYYDVITSLQGSQVAEPHDITDPLLFDFAYDDTVTLTVYRGGGYHTLSITLEPFVEY